MFNEDIEEHQRRKPLDYENPKDRTNAKFMKKQNVAKPLSITWSITLKEYDWCKIQARRESQEKLPSTGGQCRGHFPLSLSHENESYGSSRNPKILSMINSI